MRTIGLIAQETAARWPVIQKAKTETIRTVKEVTAKLLVKCCGLCKRLVITMNQNRDVALFFVLNLIELRKVIGRGDQHLLKVGGGNFPPVADIGKRLFIADPVCQAMGADVRSNAALAPVVYHPIFWHLVKEVGWLMHQANRPKIVGKIVAEQVRVRHCEIASFTPAAAPRVTNHEALGLVVVTNSKDSVAPDNTFLRLGHL